MTTAPAAPPPTFCTLITASFTREKKSQKSKRNNLLQKTKFSLMHNHVEQLQRDVLTYTTTHKENKKTRALSTLGLRLVSEEGQKTIKEEGRKEDRQQVEAKQFSESKHKFKRTS